MDMSPTVELRILDDRIHTWGLPAYGSDAAAGIDLFACVTEPLVIRPHTPAQLVPSGIAIHIGDPHIAALIVPRSGLGHRQGLVMGNLVGVIDADYLGPLLISVWNRNPADTDPIVIEPGDRIAQLLFVPVIRPQFTLVSDFSRATQRGSGGFGSTGNALPAAKSAR